MCYTTIVWIHSFRKGAVDIMSDMDFTEWGREIGDKIEEFINSKEMKDLQENIRHTVEDKMADVRRSAKKRQSM